MFECILIDVINWKNNIRNEYSMIL